MRKVKSIDDFLSHCTPWELQQIARLRVLIEECGEFDLKISYGVPYFYRHRRVVFLWPASAAFGPKTGLLFGFCQGSMIIDHHGFLEHGDRKQVSWVHITEQGEAPVLALRDYLMQAVMIDDQWGGSSLALTKSAAKEKSSAAKRTTKKSTTSKHQRR